MPKVAWRHRNARPDLARNLARLVKRPVEDLSRDRARLAHPERVDHIRLVDGRDRQKNERDVSVSVTLQAPEVRHDTRSNTRLLRWIHARECDARLPRAKCIETKCPTIWTDQNS